MDGRIIGSRGRKARPARKRPAFSGQNPITDRANQPSKNDSAVHDSVKTLPIKQLAGLALFRVVLVEIRVKHARQLLPKLFQPRRLFRVEFPFPLKRRRRGIAFTILLRRFSLIVTGRCSCCRFLTSTIGLPEIAKFYQSRKQHPIFHQNSRFYLFD